MTEKATPSHSALLEEAMSMACESISKASKQRASQPLTDEEIIQAFRVSVSTNTALLRVLKKRMRK